MKRLPLLLSAGMWITTAHPQGAAVMTGPYSGTTPNNAVCYADNKGGTKDCGAAPGGVPSGMVAFITSGACPSGWTENDDLVGYNVLVTSTANADVGTHGGSNSYTPAGSVAAPTFTGSAGTVPAQTFTGSAGTVPAETFTGSAGTVPAETFTGSQGTTSATSAGTPAGTNGTVTVATTSGSFKGTSSGGFSQIGGVGPGSSFTVPAETFTGSAMSTHTHTLTPAGTNGTVSFTPAGTNSTVSFTPAGTNSTASFTPAGTNSAPAFTGTPATITPPYYKVIACQKN